MAFKIGSLRALGYCSAWSLVLAVLLFMRAHWGTGIVVITDRHVPVDVGFRTTCTLGPNSRFPEV